MNVREFFGFGRGASRNAELRAEATAKGLDKRFIDNYMAAADAIERRRPVVFWAKVTVECNGQYPAGMPRAEIEKSGRPCLLVTTKIRCGSRCGQHCGCKKGARAAFVRPKDAQHEIEDRLDHIAVLAEMDAMNAKPRYIMVDHPGGGVMYVPHALEA